MSTRHRPAPSPQASQREPSRAARQADKRHSLPPARPRTSPSAWKGARAARRSLDTSRIRGAEASAVRDIRERLQHLEVGGPSALEWFLPALEELVDADRAFSMQLAIGPSTIEVDRVHFPRGSARRLRDGCAEAVRTKPDGFTSWDPICPEPAQRNRVISAVELLGWDGLKAQLIYQRALAPSGIGDRDQLRALVCDGPALLAWVGTARPAVFTQREIRLYQALVPVLTRRLILERDLGFAPASLALLDLALESISAPAYVLHRGWIAHANAAGREALDADAPGVRDEIAAAVARRAPDGISVSTLGAPGAPTYALVVDRRPRRETLPRVIEAARCWWLTARQVEVLRLVAEGRSNKTIAVILGCSERTVEVHVAALLERSESESRAMLVARLWSEFG